jgi:hypothetical protein
MKSPKLDSIYEPIRAVIPPELSERILSHYGRKAKNGYISRKAMEGFWRRFNEDPGFHERVWSTAMELAETVFDVDNPSWGNWPDSLEECAGVGFILGAIFQEDAESVVIELPEQELAKLETESREESASLCDLLFNRLASYKEAAGASDSWRGGEA